MSFPNSVEALRPLASKYAGSIPVDFLLAWIDHESGGRVSAVSSIGEHGLFQVFPGADREQGQLGLDDEAFQRLLTDKDFAMRIGVKLVQQYAKRASKLLAESGADWGSGSSYWKFVKLFHAATAMPKFSMAAFIRDHARSPFGWDELQKYVLEEKPRLAEDSAFASKLAALAKKVFPNSSKVGGVVPESFLVLALEFAHPYIRRFG